MVPATRRRTGGRCTTAAVPISAAVDWLEAGVHIKAVADLLGHSSIAITGDVYGHTSDDTGGPGCSPVTAFCRSLNFQ